MRSGIIKKVTLILSLWIGCTCILPSILYANVTKKFSTARQLFDRQKYKQAEQLLNAIIRQYPDHKASYYLLGRIAYRNGKMRKATSLFMKSGSSFIVTGGAFEYGITMFSAKRYNQAILGLKQVNPRSPNRGLADFYLGVSYYNLKRFNQADSHLRQARNLPQKLETSRRSFLRETKRQLELERAGRFVPQIPLYAPPPVQQGYYYEQPSAQRPGASTPETKEPEPKTEVKSGFSTSIAPRLAYAQESTFTENHGYARGEFVNKGISGGLGMNFRYDDSGGSAYTMDLDLNFRSKSSSNAVIKNIVYEDDPGVIVGQRSPLAGWLDRVANTIVKPGLVIPISSHITFNGYYEFTLVMPEMRFDESTQVLHPSASLEISLGDISLDLNANIKEFIDNAGEQADQATIFKGSVGKRFESFELSLNGSMSQSTKATDATLQGFQETLSMGGAVTKSFDDVKTRFSLTHQENIPPSQTIVSGPRSQFIFNGEITIPFEFNITLTGGGKFAMINEHITAAKDTREGAVEDSKMPLGATGTTTGFNGKLTFNPTSWLNASATFSRDEIDYVVKDKALQTEFHQATADVITSSSFSIGVSLSF